MEKCDKCGEFIEFACPLCAHYEKERLKRSAKKCKERARKAEELARELVSLLEVVSRYLEGRLELDLDLVHETNGLLERAKEVLEND